MLDLYQKIEKHLDDKLPFVVYSKPNSTKISAVFQNDAQLHEIKDFTEIGFAFVSFDGSKKYYIPSETSDIYSEALQDEDFFFTNNELNFDAEARENFEKLVQNGITAIENNQFEKVVLSRTEKVAILDFDVVKTLKMLLQLYPSAFKYCFYHPEIGLWIGATPEQFIKIDENNLKTVALAGTQIFTENVIWQTKEKEEQLFVSNFIVDNLKDFSDEISVSEPYTFQAGSICHIKTDIDVILNDKNDLEKIIQKLHPTPAVCGLPKENAKEFIIKNEGYNREFYSGFLGELNVDIASLRRDKSDLFVNLRCMKVEEKSVNLYIGCGITKDSNPQKEFMETVNKSMTMKKVL